MLFDGGEALESGRIFLVLSVKSHRLPGFLLPLLDDLRIACDLHSPPIVVKGHPPGESLLVKPSKRGLKSMIICGTQKLAGQCAPGDGRKVALDRLLLHDLSFIELILFFCESISFERGRVHSYRT